MTAAATTPVVAASSAPTRITRRPARRAPGEHLADGLEQVLGHARALEDDAHQREERDRQQRVVLHDAEDAQGQGLEQIAAKRPASMPTKP